MKSINDFGVSDTVWILNKGKVCCCVIIAIEKVINMTDCESSRTTFRLLDLDVFLTINDDRILSKNDKFTKMKEKSIGLELKDASLIFRTKEELAKFVHDSIINKGTNFNLEV